MPSLGQVGTLRNLRKNPKRTFNGESRNHCQGDPPKPEKNDKNPKPPSPPPHSIFEGVGISGRGELALGLPPDFQKPHLSRKGGEAFKVLDALLPGLLHARLENAPAQRLAGMQLIPRPWVAFSKQGFDKALRGSVSSKSDFQARSSGFVLRRWNV